MLFGEQVLLMRLYEVRGSTARIFQHMAVSRLAQHLPVPGGRMKAEYCASREPVQR